MAIGPFSTYSPPGVYVQTVAVPALNQLLGGLRVPTYIGVAQESLTQTNYELIRGSSSVADTPVFGEDPTGRFVISGPNNNPVLGNANGNVGAFKVRNYPIVDGSGVGRTTFDPTKVSVTVNGNQVIVSTVDGTNGVITLLIPPQAADVVSVNYFFHRGDTRITDDVSGQVTVTPGILVAPKAETYNVMLGVNDTLTLTVDDTNTVSIKLTAGPTRAAADVANDINAAAVVDLTASVHIDNQGLNHVQLISQGNILVGSGNANGTLGFNPGQTTGRNKVLRVFNGPIVDGSGGGITTTDPSKVVVIVNNQQVLASAVDGLNQNVTLPFAPKPGSTVAITYYFNTWQDTFDYLPNSNVVSVTAVGIAPGRTDFINGSDFVVVNDGEQSTIQWGTAFTVAAGNTTGTQAFDSTVISGLLVDNRIFGAPLARFTDPTTNAVSTTQFVLPISPTTGNGRDTPLGQSLYQTITNGRIDLPTNRPDLVIVYVGKSWRDAVAHPAVQVTAVDSATNLVTLTNPVPADYQAFATFWYNRIGEDVFTFTVQAVGPSGVGQYTVASQAQGLGLFNVTFGTVAGLSKQVQWPSGVQNVTDAFLSGSGTPVAETVTVQFLDSLDPATHASFSNANSDPYDIYPYTQQFGGVVVDGNSPVSVNLSLAYKALLVGQPVTNPIAPTTTDVLVLNIDGVQLAPVALSGLTTVAQVATAINAVVDADVQTHTDGSTTFSSTAPNALASVTAYGAQVLLQIKGRNILSFTNGLSSNVTVLTPVLAGQTNGAGDVGLAANNSAFGSYNAINQVATVVGTRAGPFNITAGATDNLQLNIDGSNFGVTLPGGTAVATADVVAAINDAYLSVASPADIATMTASLVSVTNDIKAHYNTHIASTTYHVNADTFNPETGSNAVDLASSITLLTNLAGKYNAHLTQATIHQINDAINGEVLAPPTTLQTAVAFAHDLQEKFNSHLLQMGIHGHDDTTNISAAPAAVDLASSEVLANDLKTRMNAHFLAAGVHLTNDVTNTITLTNAVDLATTIALANQEKTNFNAHVVSTTYHVVSDTTNAVTAATAVDLPTAETLLNAIQLAYNTHRTQTEGSFHVHGTNDLVDTSLATLSNLVAYTGQGVNAGEVVLVSRTNTIISQVSVLQASTATTLLGLVSGIMVGRTQPTAVNLANALNVSSSFGALAVAYGINVPGLGNFLEINSRSTGSTSTLSFTSVANTTFIPDTGIGVIPGTSGAIGENSMAGYQVSSSAGSAGSHGTGFPGQTYTDATTGLRFSVLPATSGDYDNGGSFTLVVNPTFTCDAAVPTLAVPGVEVTVFNTLNMAIGTTGVVSTFPHKGFQPSIGDVYYISYQYEKTDLSPQLYRDLKTIQSNFGPPTPTNALSLAASLALLNGAVIVALEQVLRSPGGSQAPTSAYTAAITTLRSQIAGTVSPDTITPLATDPTIFTFLNQHCVFMSSPRQEGERTGWIGTAVGTTPLGVAAIAQGLSSELMVVSYPDSFVINITDSLGNVTQQLVDGSFAAAALAGSTCNPAIDVASPITRRQILGFNSLGRILDPTDANQVAVSGVSIIEQVTSGLRVRHGLTTRLDTVITRTPSVTLTIQYIQQTMRATLDPYIGSKLTNATLKAIETQITGMFGNLIDRQIVQSVSGISVATDTTDPTIVRVEAIYVPVFPLEYIVATLQIRVSQ